MDAVRSRWTATARIDLSILAMCAGALALSFVLHPGDELVSLFGWEIPPLCAFRNVFGASCPGCGLTRAWVYISHGDPGAAWRMNKLGFLMYAVAAGQVPWRGWLLWRAFR